MASYSINNQVNAEFKRNGVTCFSNNTGKEDAKEKRRKFLGGTKKVKAKKPSDKTIKPALISNGICTKCGLKAKWLSVNGKWQLKNMDDTNHYDLCRETQGIGKVYVPKLIGVTGKDTKIADFEGIPWKG
jgi:hypothetical protein